MLSVALENREPQLDVRYHVDPGAEEVRDRASAEDVTAQAFERAYRRRRLFDARRGSERAWVFGIARNAALDELRRRKRVAALAADVEDVDAAAPGDHVQRAAAQRFHFAAFGQ